MHDLITLIAPLEALRATHGDAVADAALAPLRQMYGEAAVAAALAAIRAHGSPTSATPQQAIQASDGSQIDHVRQQTVYGDYYEAPPDPHLPRQERALRTYLVSMANGCNALALSSLDPTDAAHRRPLELARVYIGLHTTTQVRLTDAERTAQAERPRRSDAERDMRPLTALEALVRADQRRMLLLGAPGSGKSTFVNHLALCLAGAALQAQGLCPPQPEGGWLAQLPGWTSGTLLPIRVILRDFAAFPALAHADQGSVALLRDFLLTTLAAGNCAEALEPLTSALDAGRALLLLDGLDEVVGHPALAHVTESIVATARTYAHSPILVTCRILDYQAERLRQLPGFPTHTLADLTDEQVAQFVADWYAELAASGRRSTSQAAADTRALQQAIAARPELRDLARLPLLLTVMALVHANKGTLPDARALLYYECIDILLLRWRQSRGEHDLLTRLGVSQFRSSDLLALMARLGFAAHERAERSAEEVNRPADLSESEVMRLLADGFAQYDDRRKYHLAEMVLHALMQGNGLLLKRGPDVYAFPHRTFQEFLAGYHLLRQPNALRLCLERSPQAQWHEALLLMAGYQVLAGGEFDKPLSLVEKLLERSPREQVLAGELLTVLGRERVAGYDPALLASGGLWRRVHRALLRLAVQGQAPAVPATLRVRAGLVMGRLCVYDQDAVTTPIVDPRLPLALIGLSVQQSPRWHEALQAYWCPISAGPFWYGDDRKGPLQPVTLSYDFQIARYPVTNADFARFIATDGYADPRWWTDHCWRFLQPGRHDYVWEDNAQPITRPRLWDDSVYNTPIQPVVGVSWYEAVAYCAWLTDQGHSQGWLSTDQQIRLPTALEWERAARHTDRRRYPWGDAPPDAERANYKETGIGRPSPVGCFPQGRAVCGALDLAGNVMEWLATPDGAEQQIKPEKDFTHNAIVLRTYSDFRDEPENLCCGSRDWGYPGDRLSYQGFRLVRFLRSSE